MLLIIDDATALETKLRVPEQEQELFEKAREIVSRYELDQNLVEKFFKWVIDITTKVEIEYLKKKISVPRPY